MIKVTFLSKQFGPIVALDRVSFDVGDREVMGFLGPNGAGKSTALRILTGFLPFDSGEVSVAGVDVRTNSVAARQVIGYLPEGVPLYPEMRVGEYLRFRSRLKGIRRADRKARIRDALDKTQVGDVERRIVGTLSKGYRQRVGLADALLGDPRLLILDEPTVGLDPAQVRQFRALVQEEAKSRSVILSSHVLSEVEQVAHRITIIHRGRVLAQDRTEALRRRLRAVERLRVELAGADGKPVAPDALSAFLRGVPGVACVALAPEPELGAETAPEAPPGEDPKLPFVAFSVELQSDGGPAVREEIFRRVVERGFRLRELSRQSLGLEEIFLGIIDEGRKGQAEAEQ